MKNCMAKNDHKAKTTEYFGKNRDYWYISPNIVLTYNVLHFISKFTVIQLDIQSTLIVIPSRLTPCYIAGKNDSKAKMISWSSGAEIPFGSPNST